MNAAKQKQQKSVVKVHQLKIIRMPKTDNIQTITHTDGNICNQISKNISKHIIITTKCLVRFN